MSTMFSSTREYGPQSNIISFYFFRTCQYLQIVELSINLTRSDFKLYSTHAGNIIISKKLLNLTWCICMLYYDYNNNRKRWPENVQRNNVIFILQILLNFIVRLIYLHSSGSHIHTLHNRVMKRSAYRFTSNIYI